MASLVFPLMSCAVSWPWVRGAGHLCSDGAALLAPTAGSPCVRAVPAQLLFQLKIDLGEVHVLEHGTGSETLMKCKGVCLIKKNKKGLQASKNTRVFPVGLLTKWTIGMSFVVYISSW